MSVDEYNSLLKLSFPVEKATSQDMKSYKESSHGREAVEAFSFLDTLK